MRSKNRGFQLIELLLVLGLTSIFLLAILKQVQAADEKRNTMMLQSLSQLVSNQLNDFYHHQVCHHGQLDSNIVDQPISLDQLGINQARIPAWIVGIDARLVPTGRELQTNISDLSLTVYALQIRFRLSALWQKQLPALAQWLGATVNEGQLQWRSLPQQHGLVASLNYNNRFWVLDNTKQCVY